MVVGFYVYKGEVVDLHSSFSADSDQSERAGKPILQRAVPSGNIGRWGKGCVQADIIQVDRCIGGKSVPAGRNCQRRPVPRSKLVLKVRLMEGALSGIVGGGMMVPHVGSRACDVDGPFPVPKGEAQVIVGLEGRKMVVLRIIFSSGTVR